MTKLKRRSSQSTAQRIQVPKIEITIEEPSINEPIPGQIATDKPAAKQAVTNQGLEFSRVFTQDGTHPFAAIEWKKANSKIIDEKGKVIFEYNDIEAPASWSQLAIDIAAYKYLRKRGLPTPEGRETSIRQLVSRVASTLRAAGENFGGYFASKGDAQIFEDELTHLLVNQMGAFNSPVWFNCGLYHSYGIEGSSGTFFWQPTTDKIAIAQNAYEHPQCSACFIQRVEDDIRSIFDLVKNEAILFKYGSGTGSNFSRIRGRNELLSGGGVSSGLMSFLKVLDAGAGSIKSGGTTRRAAKMVVLDIDHPEIIDFIEWKAKEERKAKLLIQYGGYEPDFNSEAYRTVSGQNSNNSVRITDDFMNAYLENKNWSTIERTTGNIAKTYQAKELMDLIAKSAWECADPGVQFDTTINQWHTCPNTDRIYSSNPCSEYMFLDDSACNLASLNLMKYSRVDGTIDPAKLQAAVKVFITAMEIIVDFAAYPTEKIAQNSHEFRPLGLGYANLGTLLMVNGIPYDCETARAWAGAITAILHSTAYAVSAEIAATKGPFLRFSENRTPFLRVTELHRQAAYTIKPLCPSDLLEAAHQSANQMVKLGQKSGYRNAQATNIAPTGTIGLLMDCDTTGVEPDFALVKFKKLAGGGYFKIVNQSVPQALQRLGYNEQQINDIIRYVLGTGTFDCDAPINRLTLSQKGLTDAEIDQINQQVPSAFDLTLVFNRLTINQPTLDRLNLSESNILTQLGYSADEIDRSNKIICGTMTVEGAPHLKDEHLTVFDCANKSGKYSRRYIAPMGHVDMMAAVQPFISGAISKTVNIPNEATVEDINNIYVESWKKGLKSIALYRDGSKSSQPLSTTTDTSGGTTVEPKVETQIIEIVRRHRLPDDRKAITHKFSIAGHDGYLTIGLYDDGTPGEVFIRMAKQGSTINGLMDSFAVAISMSLQYGVPLRVLVNKFTHVRFDPSGITTNPKIWSAKSVVDYIFRYLAIKFLPKEEWDNIGIHVHDEGDEENNFPIEPPTVAQSIETKNQPDLFGQSHSPIDQSITKMSYDLVGDAPTCGECGGMMTRSGSCYKCMNCGSTSGCS